MYRLIAIDIDGTLLDDNKQIPQKNIEAINKASNKGIKVILCSGRVLGGVRIFADILGLGGYMIGLNGAYIGSVNDNENCIYNKIMNKSSVLSAIHEIKELELHYNLYSGEILYTEKLGMGYSADFYTKYNKTTAQVNKKRIEIRVNDDMKGVVLSDNIQINKLIVMSEEYEKLKYLKERLKTLEDVTVTTSGENNVEIIDKKASKGNALSFLADKFGFCSNEIAAIGDNDNDISMLKYAGLAIAMGNATAGAKSNAGVVTLSNNDAGVGAAIEKYILEETHFQQKQ